MLVALEDITAQIIWPYFKELGQRAASAKTRHARNRIQHLLDLLRIFTEDRPVKDTDGKPNRYISYSLDHEVRTYGPITMTAQLGQLRLKTFQ